MATFFDNLRIKTLDHITTITFYRRDARNAFTNQMYLELAEAINQADQDEDVRVIILTAKGKFFCAGQDLREMNLPVGAEEVGFLQLFKALKNNRKPILGAVNGSGVGLGLTLLLHMDINIIDDKARFWLPFTELAVCPEAASSYLLPKFFGMQRTAEILYTARWIEAQELLDVGLALELVPQDDVLDRTLELAKVIAQKPPLSVQKTRELIRAPHVRDIAHALRREGEAFEELLGTPEQESAIGRFFKDK